MILSCDRGQVQSVFAKGGTFRHEFKIGLSSERSFLTFIWYLKNTFFSSRFVSESLSSKQTKLKHIRSHDSFENLFR